MKFSLLASVAFAATALAVPTSLGHAVQARAGSASDVCDIGYCTQNGGTTGGSGGSQTTVKTLADLKKAAGASGKAIVVVSGTISGSEQIDVASDKTIIGAAGSQLTGVGLRVKSKSNVIIRNMKIAKVTADAGDAITIQASSNVWVDHCDLSSDMNNGKDYYDGLCDINHGSNYVTVSNTYFHDHYKGSLVGHSDSNSAEDTGKLIVTYANNYWKNINSRGPSLRFGTGHVFNTYMENMDTGINTRMGAQMLVESTAFSGVKKAIMSADSDSVGYANVNDVSLGSGTNTAQAGSLKASSIPYKYTLLGSGKVKASVTANAGQTLSI